LFGCPVPTPHFLARAQLPEHAAIGRMEPEGRTQQCHRRLLLPILVAAVRVQDSDWKESESVLVPRRPYPLDLAGSRDPRLRINTCVTWARRLEPLS
jgi:hypothetical protein